MSNILNPAPRIEGFGPVRQLGHVVENIEAEIQHWQEAENLGPWMIMRNVRLPCVYRGQKSEPVIHVALAYRGEMQIELIQQVNDAASPYLATRDARQFGLHHMAHLCVDLDADVLRAQAMGWNILCDINMMGSRYVYMSRVTDDEEVFVEFLPASLVMRTMFSQGIAAAKRWDGTQKTMVIDMKNVGSLLGSLPGATRAWLSQR